MRQLVALLILVLFTGCSIESETKWVELQPQRIEQPASNLPVSLRHTNWADRAGSGSCVIASSASTFEWFNRPDLAHKFRTSYAGGQTESTTIAKWKANGIPFVATKSLYDIQRDGGGIPHGDPEFLEWVTRTRRMAIIWFYQSHCVNFCGFGIHQGKPVAWLLDNNKIKNFIPVPKDQFIRDWRNSYGGFAATPLYTPAPQLPFQGYYTVQK